MFVPTDLSENSLKRYTLTFATLSDRAHEKSLRKLTLEIASHVSFCIHLVFLSHFLFSPLKQRIGSCVKCSEGAAAKSKPLCILHVSMQAA